MASMATTLTALPELGTAADQPHRIRCKRPVAYLEDDAAAAAPPAGRDGSRSRRVRLAARAVGEPSV